jgi:hypothetical protein
VKIFFNYCDLNGYMDYSGVKFGIGWYRHNKDMKWWGLTIEGYLLFWVVQCTFVSNWKEYDKRINHWKYRKKT